MKINAGTVRPKATHIFTDREEPQASFWKTYNNLDELIKKDPDNEELTVLSYYGVGGVGKTKLLQKLLKELLDNNRKAVYFDFSIEKDHLLVLESIKNRLYKDYGFKFTLFEAGHYVYANKVGQIREMPGKETFLARYPALDAVVEVLGTVPTVNIVSQFVKAFDKGITWFRNSKDKFEALLRELESQEPQELYDDLTELFWLDMQENLREKKIKEPFVVMLDTYEEFVGEGASESDSIKNESWINGPQGLIQKLSNVLWVIAGRNKLKWGDEWRKPDENGWISLEEHIINGLSEPDAISFLKETGIDNEELCKKLYGLTEGLPVYLDLCVDRYYEIKGRDQEPSFDKFGESIETLVARFVKNLDHNTKELVYILSCLRIWNDEMVQEIVPQVYKGFTLSLYEKIKDYSFIVLPDETTFNMHQTVGDILFKKCPDSIKKATETSVVEFMDKKFSTINAFSGEYVFYTRWLMQYALRTFQDDEKLSEFFDSEIKDRLEELSRCGQFKAAYDILGPLIKWAENSEDKKFCVYVLNAFSKFLSNAGEYKDAFELCLDAANLAEEIVFDDGDNFFRYDMMLMFRNLGNCLNDIGRYDDALEIFNNLLADWKDILGDKQEETLEEELLEEMNNVANTLVFSGKYQEALALQEKLLEKQKEISGENSFNSIRLMSNMANTLSELGRFNEALEVEKKVLTKFKVKFGENDPNTIIAMAGLSGTLTDLGRHEEALALNKTVLAKRKEVLGENHPDTIGAMANLSTSLSCLGRYEEAIALEEQALAELKEVLGEDHPDTIAIMNNIASDLSHLGRNEEALELRKTVLEKRKEILGEDHPDTIAAANNLASELMDLGRHEESLALKKTVLAKRKEVLGENHPDTIASMNDFAWALLLSKKFQESLPYAEEVVKLENEDSNIPEKSKINSLDTLALLYAETGNIDKSIEIASNNLEKSQKLYSFDRRHLASMYYTMAFCLNKAKRYDEALPYAEQAYTIRKEQIGDDRIDSVRAKELLEDIKNKLN